MRRRENICSYSAQICDGEVILPTHPVALSFIVSSVLLPFILNTNKEDIFYLFMTGCRCSYSIFADRQRVYRPKSPPMGIPASVFVVV